MGVCWVQSLHCGEDPLQPVLCTNMDSTLSLGAQSGGRGPEG